MRPSFKLAIALNGILAAAGGCDEVATDDPVALRCLPPGCTTNSPYVGNPYVGTYPFANLRTLEDATAPSPVVASADESHWSVGWLERADHSWMAFDFLYPTAEGRLFAYDSASQTTEAVDQGLQAFFILTLTDASDASTTHIPIWLKAVSSDSVLPTFDVWKYTIAAKAAPPASTFPSEGSPASVPPTIVSDLWSGTYYSICPASVHESGEALILQYSELKLDGDAAWLEDGLGLGSLDDELPATSVIACQGHAFSKPQEFLGITPNSYVDVNDPGERSYGLADYNAAANAYRAFYDGQSRTVLGTPVHFKDLRHDPPWFDQTTSAYLPPTPIVGSWQFILESVYKDVDAFGDPLGATCYYTDADFPAGVHRLHDPPGGNANLPGWSSMPSCGAAQTNWDDFGPIGAFVLEHVLPAPPSY